MFHHTLPQLYALATQEGKLVLRLEIVEVYRECGSIRETARRLSVSRNTVRKWVDGTGKKGRPGFTIARGGRNVPPPHSTGGRGEGA